MKHRASDNFFRALLTVLAAANTIEDCGRYQYQIENAVMLAKTALIKALLDLPRGTNSK